ncbi:hypothetical protein Moror_3868 [Moniliophthora roreri MCA 2997]|uniref:SMODS and SLOG-associating 2TM effector domain-containing protein n=1 Tax=Moniliophthora roreri (strain MCA 2997) TaxID=1381753 RepID=V2XS99_MONRO|nr:hypothetical protein Moror_3868 [Moniliophthora roreri MCA 2997]
MDNEKPTVRPVPSSPAPTPGPSSQSNPPALGNPPAQPAPGSSTNLAPAELTTPRPISFTQGHSVPTPILTSPPPGPSSQSNPPALGNPPAQPAPGSSTNLAPAEPTTPRPISFTQGHFVPTPILTAPPPARVVSVDEKPHVHGEVTSQKAASLDRASTYDRRMTPLPPLPGHGSPVIHASPVDETGGMLQPGGAMPTDLGRMGTMNSRRSNIDWIVPQLKEAREVAFRPKTVGERLEPTLIHAKDEKEKFAAKARLTGLALNIAIGLQVLLGALTTGLSAVTTGRQTSIAVSVLGGLSTLVASYLARTRGSNEPELSIARTKDLEQFIRECEAFKLDKGHENGHDYDARLEQLRARFEELLGNASG